MDLNQPTGGGKKQGKSDDNLDKKMEGMSLGDAETPESAQFRSLPQAMQRRLLVDYPRVLATAMHQYSQGDSCEDILLQVFEGSPEMLSVRNTQGDNPMAAALVRGQGDRADKLVDLADRRRPHQLDSRSQFGETLLMLSTLSNSSATLMERLLLREPTQLHRLYDNDGRNFLHHCALEKSIEALNAGLQVTLKLIQENRLVAERVSAALHMNDSRGDTPLHLMAASNRVDMMQRLVHFCEEAGISVRLDERQHRGSRWTPLMSAVAAGAVESAEFLLNHGADLDEEDSEGRTAASMAAASGDERMRQLFESGSDGAVGGGEAAQELAWTISEQSEYPVDSGVGTCGELSASQLFESDSDRAVGDGEMAQKISQAMAHEMPWTMPDQPVLAVDSGIGTFDELGFSVKSSTSAVGRDEMMRQNLEFTAGDEMALNLTKLHQLERTGESGICMLHETDECMEQDDGMDAEAQEDSGISVKELEQLEVRLKQSGKTMGFLHAVSRSVKLEIPSIVCVAENPLLTAFSCWNATDKHVSRSLAMAIMREVHQA